MRENEPNKKVVYSEKGKELQQEILAIQYSYDQIVLDCPIDVKKQLLGFQRKIENYIEEGVISSEERDDLTLWAEYLLTHITALKSLNDPVAQKEREACQREVDYAEDQIVSHIPKGATYLMVGAGSGLLVLTSELLSQELKAEYAAIVAETMFYLGWSLLFAALTLFCNHLVAVFTRKAYGSLVSYWSEGKDLKLEKFPRWPGALTSVCFGASVGFFIFAMLTGAVELRDVIFEEAIKHNLEIK